MKPNYQVNADFATSYFGSLLGECCSWQDGPVWAHDSLKAGPGECVPYALHLKIKPGKHPEVWINTDLPNDLLLRIVGYCTMNALEIEYFV